MAKGTIVSPVCCEAEKYCWMETELGPVLFKRGKPSGFYHEWHRANWFEVLRYAGCWVGIWERALRIWDKLLRRSTK